MRPCGWALIQSDGRPCKKKGSLPRWQSGKESACNAGDIRGTGSISGSERPLEEHMATHSSNLAWRISWTEEPGELWSNQLSSVI